MRNNPCLEEEALGYWSYICRNQKQIILVGNEAEDIGANRTLTDIGQNSSSSKLVQEKDCSVILIDQDKNR